MWLLFLSTILKIYLLTYSKPGNILINVCFDWCGFVLIKGCGGLLCLDVVIMDSVPVFYAFDQCSVASETMYLLTALELRNFRGKKWVFLTLCHYIFPFCLTKYLADVSHLINVFRVVANFNKYIPVSPLPNSSLCQHHLFPYSSLSLP